MIISTQAERGTEAGLLEVIGEVGDDVWVAVIFLSLNASNFGRGRCLSSAM
jgi:hypothetical protein